MAKCAFIGLGIMGYPMAGHLQAKGHDVCVYNRTAQKAEAWAKQHGGRTAPTPREAAAGAEFVFMCVGNDDDIRSVVYGDDGALAGLGADRVLVDHTTASADIARELEAAAKDQGKQFIDAPVSGGQAGAENGALTIMCGGERGGVRAGQAGHGGLRPRGHPDGPGGRRPADQDGQPDLHRRAGPGPGRRRSTSACARASTCRKVIEVISKGAAQSWQMENRAGDHDPGQVRFRLPGHVDAQGPQDLHGGGEPQRRAAPDHRADRPVLPSGMKAGGSRWDTSSLIHNLRLLD